MGQVPSERGRAPPGVSEGGRSARAVEGRTGAIAELRQLARVWEVHLPEHESLAPHENVYLPYLISVARDAGIILDIGAGRGRMGKILQENGVTGTMVSLDLNDYVRECVGPSCVGDAQYLPFTDEEFDLVFSIGVVEHLSGLGRSIAEHARVARGGGYVLINTPCLSVFTPLRWIVWSLKYRNRGSFNHLMGRNLTIREVRSEMERSGLKVVETGRCGWYLPAFTKRLRSAFRWILPERVFGAYLWCLGVKL